jgi:AcrR family transcriptional regulator
MKRKGNIESNDRRVKYTKMVIRQSLMTLISKMPLAKISVTDICQQADINRGTFYAYYKDPTDLYEQIKKNLFEEIESPLNGIIDTSTVYDLLLQIFRSIQQNKDLCTIILNNSGDKEFLYGIIDIVRGKFLSLWHEKVPEIPVQTLEYLFTFTANGSTGVLQEWLTKGSTGDTPEKMAHLVEQMSTNVFLSYLHAGA